MSVQFVLFTLFRATSEGRISEGRGGAGETTGRETGKGREGRGGRLAGRGARKVKDSLDRRGRGEKNEATGRTAGKVRERRRKKK